MSDTLEINVCRPSIEGNGKSTFIRVVVLPTHTIADLCEIFNAPDVTVCPPQGMSMPTKLHSSDDHSPLIPSATYMLQGDLVLPLLSEGTYLL
ncbi:hypothetical protein HYX12_04875 [Candidatus Woesearchaeota archaeon]|nr:hypothetical protein [Candidatus Woesearchaeota archaeon]